MFFDLSVSGEEQLNYGTKLGIIRIYIFIL